MVVHQIQPNLPETLSNTSTSALQDCKKLIRASRQHISASSHSSHVTSPSAVHPVFRASASGRKKPSQLLLSLLRSEQAEAQHGHCFQRNSRLKLLQTLAGHLPCTLPGQLDRKREVRGAVRGGRRQGAAPVGHENA
eukprot:312953-Hanusia_phi.AAC.1